MDRLVAVRFRIGDVVVKLIRHVAEVGMNNPQRGVAVLQTLGHDAHGAHIKQLIKGEMLFLHFAPDAVDMLRPAVDFGLHALFFHRLT
ncbi:hypothetical protein D3C76_1469800 [compost metagenome]